MCIHALSIRGDNITPLIARKWEKILKLNQNKPVKNLQAWLERIDIVCFCFQKQISNEI